MLLKYTTIPSPGGFVKIGRRRIPGFAWVVFDKTEERRTGVLRPIATFHDADEAERYIREAKVTP